MSVSACVCSVECVGYAPGVGAWGSKWETALERENTIVGSWRARRGARARGGGGGDGGDGGALSRTGSLLRYMSGGGSGVGRLGVMDCLEAFAEDDAKEVAASEEDVEHDGDLAGRC